MSHGSNPMPPHGPKPAPPPNPPVAPMPAGTRELIRAIEDNTAALRELIAMNAKTRTPVIPDGPENVLIKNERVIP